jgi:putative transposase
MKWKNQYPDNHCFFITSSVIGYRPILDLEGIPEMLLNNLDKCRGLFEFKLLGYVIMPEHWHILAYFASGKDCLAFTRDYKRFTAVEIIAMLTIVNEIESVQHFKNAADNRTRHAVWKEQARVIPIAGMDRIKSKLDYIHNNPVKRGLVNTPIEYMYSSAGYYLGIGGGKVKLDSFEGLC